ncbi:MAG TPA: hypothetical protein DCG41_05690 [Verrucomicrobiales bacterium]|nr:hypothetical protein [Verrucomicrobiales bacterium]
MRRNVMKAIRQRHFEILILIFLSEGSRIISRTSKISLVKVVVVGVLSLASEGSEKEDEDQKVRHGGRVSPVKNKIQIEDRRRGNLIHVF